MKKITLNRIILYLIRNRKLKFLSDEKFLKLKYWLVFNKKLDLDNPKTFNEKLQWLKLYDRKPVYTTMVDKYLVKEYVSNIIGQDKVIKSYGAWDSFDEIDFDKLPDKFVMKPTHASGNVFVCEDKSKIDKKALKKKVTKWLKREFFYIHREWPYKDVKPKILVEEYIKNSDGTALRDYKFYCFNGKSEYTMLCTDREKGQTKFYYINRNGELEREMTNHGMALKEDEKLPIPENLEEMFLLAEKLTKDLTFCRLDLYNVDGKIYFGEYTFFPTAGFDIKRTKKCEEYLNNSMVIKIKK